MLKKHLTLAKILALIAVVALNLIANEARAIPSFARQTNLACNVCHYLFPELRPFGRQFKLNGYTMTGIQTITSTKEDNSLNLLSTLPLSAMFETSYAHVAKTVPGTRNDNVEFPQELSFFIAGQITPRLGTFIQITYDDESGTIGWDNSDVRFANHVSIGSKDLLYGLTLNNNPTVQDVWNTIPAWSMPFSSAEHSPSPQAGTLLEGKLAQSVAGLGAYGMYDDVLYAEGDVYVSSPQGGPHPPDATSENTIKGVSPYWRLALQHQFAKHYLELGTYGIHSLIYPMGVTGPTDNFTDVAVDLQYELALGSGALIAHGNYINEKQNLDASFADTLSANPTLKLNKFRVDVGYNWDRGYALTLGYFAAQGDADTLWYPPDPVIGSANGKPDSDGLFAEFAYHPWQNTKFILQYTMYNKFNGGSSDYGDLESGRKASDNNTIFALIWITF